MSALPTTEIRTAVKKAAPDMSKPAQEAMVQILKDQHRKGGTDAMTTAKTTSKKKKARRKATKPAYVLSEKQVQTLLAQAGDMNESIRLFTSALRKEQRAHARARRKERWVKVVGGIKDGLDVTAEKVVGGVKFVGSLVPRLSRKLGDGTVSVIKKAKALVVRKGEPAPEHA